MATLFKKKDPRFPYWIARIMVNGKRMDRSTGTIKKRDAQRQAEAWEADVRKAGTQDTGIQKAFAALVESAALAAKEGRLTLDLTKTFITRLHKLANPDFVEPSLTQVFDEWLGTLASRVSGSTMDIYRDAKRHLTSALGDAANAPAHTITRTQIDAALQTLKATMRASTVNLSLRAWKRVFRYALECKAITDDPTANVKALPQGDSVKRAPFTPAEARSLIEAATGEWKGLIHAAAHTGLRLMDAVNLRKSNVQNGVLIVKPAKTSRAEKVISIELTTELRQWIESQPANDLFPKLKTKSVQLLSGDFKDIMTLAGVPDTVTLPTGETRDRSFHSLRHSANSWLAEGGVDIGTRQEILGHASAAQNLAYTTKSAANRRTAIAVLPNLATA
ncbi:MAG TPA: tyrosine-type recombinase/integrase [Verrucomicrobiales bacterium]|nr:tyrosine-type recombinase/integrase [Verrucomicrobiales bacterium]